MWLLRGEKSLPDPEPGPAEEQPTNSKGNYIQNASEIFDDVGFYNVSKRHKFLENVCVILGVNILFSCGSVAGVMHWKSLHDMVLDEWFVLLILSSVSYILNACLVYTIRAIRRRFPYNVLFIILLNISLTSLLITLSVYFNTKIIYYALAFMVVTCFFLWLFAIQTVYKGHISDPVLVIILFFSLIIFIGCTIILLSYIDESFRALDVIWASLSIVPFVAVLLIDIFYILYGVREKIKPEQIFHGALILYLDLFLIIFFISFSFTVIAWRRKKKDNAVTTPGIQHTLL